MLFLSQGRQMNKFQPDFRRSPRFFTLVTCLFGLSASGLACRAQSASEQPVDALSPYGIGADHHTSQAPEKWIPQMAAIGIKMARSAHANWYFVEPEPGQWTWTQFDQQMDCMAKNGIESGALLYGDTP